MNGSRVLRLCAVALALLLSLPALHSSAVAQEVAGEEDPPSRAARLSYRHGEVSLQAAEEAEWTTATLNRPLSVGDRLWTEENARAELQLGSTTLHLDEYTGLEITDLGDDTLALTLKEGAVNVHVRDTGRVETITIDTPNASVVLPEPGEYRIEANSAGDTTVVKVREGVSDVASLAGNSGTYRIDAGRQGIFTGTSGLTAAIDAVVPRSTFDDWSRDREARGSYSASTRYVSREVIGYEDLDDHGDWYDEPGYGHVWYPRHVVSGWAPYRFGHWAWVRPWGWTWVDDAPWGFAPFHYGRWAYVRNRWCWVPGPRSIRPVYAPALVAWVGGPSVSVSVSFGSGIGWFPLGPREVYFPGYRASRRHFTNVNVSNTVINNTYITNVYENRGRNAHYVHQGRGNAVTAVSRDDFIRGRNVDRHRIRWNDGERGVIEANTFQPERGSEVGTLRQLRPPESSNGRPDNPRNVVRRESGGGTVERGAWRNDRPAGQRDAAVAPRGRDAAPAPQVPKESLRPRTGSPAVSGDKQDRAGGQGLSSTPRSQWRTAPDPGTTRSSEGRRDERTLYRSQNESRSSGSSQRTERAREPDRSRSIDSASRQNSGAERSAPAAGQEQRSQRAGNTGGERSRRDLATQGQKREAGSRGAGKRD